MSAGTTPAEAGQSLRDVVRDADIRTVRDWLARTATLQVADELARLSREERAVPFRLLRKDRALEVFEALDPVHQEEVLDGLREQAVRRIFEEMEPDDRARLLDEMPATVAHRLLAGLTPDERELTATLLGYPDESAGRIMSPQFVSLRAGMSAAEALGKLRRDGGSAETVYALAVTDDERRLVGALGLRDLVLADPAARVGDLMETEVISARADVDQEQVARLIQEAGILALPIVDSENRMVGVVTVDDAMRVLEAEDTEDQARAGGAEPLGRPYFSVSVLQLARSRAVWLLALLVAASLTVNVLKAFEHTLEQAVTLALFIPLLIGTGGNTGAQAATTVIRAMAVGEVRLSDLAVVVLREARVGLLLGLLLGGLGFLPVMTLFGRPVATVVSLTILSICTWAALVGGLLPLLASRVGVDPAVMSAPAITTLVDATGLVLYFVIARAVLGLPV